MIDKMYVKEKEKIFFLEPFSSSKLYKQTVQDRLIGKKFADPFLVTEERRNKSKKLNMCRLYLLAGFLSFPQLLSIALQQKKYPPR